MGVTTREGLFLAYSRADSNWRDRFARQLSATFAGGDRWIDRYSIHDGENSWNAIAAAIDRVKCALLLLTPAYLSLGHAARSEELPLLLKAREHGLTLLPVLVEQCAWDDVNGLRDLQLVGWPGDTVCRDGRETKRAVEDAGMDGATPAEQHSTQERAVIEICKRVGIEFGVGRRVTDDQRAGIPRQTSEAFVGQGQLTLDPEPFYTGEFAFIYRGCIGDEPVAVKVVPTAAWRHRVECTLSVANDAREKLGGTSLVHVRQIINDPEIHAVVMEYVDWPTLHDKLAERPNELWGPTRIAALLAKVSQAQSEAHRRCVPLGALSPRAIFVGDEGDVRLSPIRIEAHLARGLALGSDHLVNWDILSMLTPETYTGQQPVSPKETDACGQYYLGMLGLELLLGHRPVEVKCFQDLAAKAAFFDDPRAHFEQDEIRSWVDECPALAFILAKLLAKDPGDRLASADVATEALQSLADGHLPAVLRRCLEDDYAEMMRDGGFTARFYARLFAARPELRVKFDNSPVDQSKHLANAMRDLVEFRIDDHVSRFLDVVDAHITKMITPEDVAAFRREFVAEVVNTCTTTMGAIAARTHGDAWDAALKLGLGVLLSRMQTSSVPGRQRPIHADSHHRVGLQPGDAEIVGGNVSSARR